MSESINRSKKSKLLIIKSSSPFLSPRRVDLEGEGIVSLCFFVNAYRSQYHVVVNLIFKVFEKIVSCIRFIIPYALTLQPKAWMGRPPPSPSPPASLRHISARKSKLLVERASPQRTVPGRLFSRPVSFRAAEDSFSSKQRDRSQIRPQQIPAEEGRLHDIFPPYTKLARFKQSV